MIGRTLSHFRIVAKLGEGGMGEVYRAEDTRLGREVAIKVLPEAFVSDADRLARFEREARILAVLEHPKIGSIFEVDEDDGVHFLAMQLAEGEDLAEYLKRGLIAVDSVLSIALQIAEALEAAHEKGIIHRDLKPSNVKVAPDGQVKVLDFGLAKAWERPSDANSDLSQSPTLTAQMTEASVILGTAAYMSPEQAQGKVLDKRSDIFSFGSVLYEMLAERKAFPGYNVPETLAAVIKTEPELSALPSGLDPRLRRLIDRCLRKDPRERLRDIGDARLELEEVRTRTDVEARDAQVTAPWRRGLPWALTAVAAVVAVVSWFGPQPQRQEPAHVQIALPPGVLLAVDTEHPVLALSPDGRRLVFVGEEDGARRLYLRDLAAAEALVIPGTEEAASPFFSPDGRWIGYLTENTLEKVPVDGGVPIAIHRSTGPMVNSGNTWASEDIVIVSGSANEGLSLASFGGDSMRPFDEWKYITDSGSATAWPYALPDGNFVTYVDTSQGSPDEARIVALDLRTLETKTLLRGGTSPRYSQTGHLLFSRGGALYGLQFDSKRAKVTGVEQKLLDGVMTSMNGAAQFAVGGNGTLAYVAGNAGIGDDELVWIDRQGRTEAIFDSSHLSEPRLSPDGTRVLVSSRTGANIDLWLLDLQRSSFTRLTSDPGEDFGGVWSPDGSRVALASEMEDEEGGPALAWMPRLGAAPEVLVESTGFGNWEFVSSWSPDGQWLAYTAVRGASQSDIWLFPIGTEDRAEPIAFLDSPTNELAGTFSPDGRWIAYVSDVSGRNEVYVRSFSDSDAPIVSVSTRGGTQPRWSRDGQELFYLEGQRLMVVRTGSGAVMELTTPEVLFEERFGRTFGHTGAGYDVSLDGSRFLMVRTKDLVMPTVIHVVLDWPAVLAEEVQTNR